MCCFWGSFLLDIALLCKENFWYVSCLAWNKALISEFLYVMCRALHLQESHYFYKMQKNTHRSCEQLSRTSAFRKTAMAMSFLLELLYLMPVRNIVHDGMLSLRCSTLASRKWVLCQPTLMKICNSWRSQGMLAAHITDVPVAANSECTPAVC